MGPHSRHPAQEGDAFCFLAMNTLWCEKCSINPGITAKDLVKMLEETGTSPILTEPERPHSKVEATAPKLPDNASLRFVTAHGVKDLTFWRNVLWSDETKI